MATETASSAADKSVRRAVQLQGTPPGRVGPESRLQGKCLSVRFHLRFLQSNSQPYENCAGKIPKTPIHQDYSMGMDPSITWECFILFHFSALLHQVTVIDTSDPDWWKGKCLGRIGYFPSKYCARLAGGEKPLQVTHNLQVSDNERPDTTMTLLRDQIVIQVRHRSIDESFGELAHYDYYLHFPSINLAR